MGAAVLLLGSCGRSAHAQPRHGSPDASDADDELVAAGIELRKEGRDAEALTAFERAYALRPTPRSLAQIALAQQALGRWRDAERGLIEAMRQSDDPWVARQRLHLEDSLAAVRTHLGWVEVEGDVAGEWEARIYDDDATCGPLGAESRSTRCGTNRAIGMAAQTIAVVAFIGAGVTAAASGVVFLESNPRPARTGLLSCHLGALAISCGAAF